MLWLLPIGLLAGVLTTVTGVGGGMVALSLLSLVMPPAVALAISAAAFAVGNTHRALMFSRSVDRRVTARFGSGLAVGAVVGAMLVPFLPTAVLRLALVAVAAASLAKAASAWFLRALPARRAARAAGEAGGGRHWPGAQLLGAGALVGAIGAGAGGAGVLVSPILLSTGLRRDAYVATVASCAIVLNGFRVVGYQLAGLYQLSMLASIAALAAALMVGNVVGARVRQHVRQPLLDRIEVGAPAIAIALTLLGV